MPAYTEKTLPDAELRDIFAYIKTLPVGPAAKDIPLLKELKP
jgi:mono/diheme cytochrome c family protein